MGRPGRAMLAAAALVLGAPEAARGARLPEWAQAIAETAPPVEEGPPHHATRVLLTETRLEVEPDGSFRTRRRLATQALSARADEAGIGLFGFVEGAKVRASRAWHLPPGEKAKKSYGSPVEIAIGDSFLTDRRARLLAMEGIRKGSLVFFEMETVDVPPALCPQEVFYEGAPIARARLEVETPPGWSLRYAWLRVEGPEPSVRGNVRIWEIRDLAPPEEEPLGEPAAWRAPILVLAFTPPPGADLKPAVLPDWASLSRWYEGVSRGRDAVTPEIEAAWPPVPPTAGSFDGPVRAASLLVRDRVRYVAKAIGAGNYQPKPAGQVLQELYGDCKDKATLLRALLAAGGLASYPMLVHASSPDTVSEEVPHLAAFDHVVVGIPLPRGAEAPPEIADAVVNAGDLGRLLVVDTTHEHAFPGMLPAYLAGKKALVVAGDRGRLVTLPPGDPSTHRIERRLEIEVQADRSLVVRMESRHAGEPASAARAAYRSSSADRRKAVERELLDVWHDAALRGYSVEPETREGAFVETVSLFVPADPAGGAVSLFPGAVESLPRVPLGKRRSGMSYGYPRTLRVETTLRGAPESAPLPAGQEARGDGWAVTSHLDTSEGAIRAVWEVALSRTRFEPDAFPELKRLWAAAAKAASPLLPLGP